MTQPTSATSVRLGRLAPAHVGALTAFELPEEQARFTALPAEGLLEEVPSRYPVVILADEEPVGFFLLHAGERTREYTDHPRSLLLTAFSISHPYQNRGYAKRGLQLLPAWVSAEFPEMDEVVLAVNGKNDAARQLYARTGFTDTGRRRMGPLGEQLILRLAIR
ncbi:GNAT family N-acetyltransferase [Paenibacillus sp. FSL W8-1187]|uniref:GNAT family N-acetyltransferase n=1 Tax=Paenibacillus sp. FSL W8-1187 TaxID=2975339 RepID=UPI0030D86E24